MFLTAQIFALPLLPSISVVFGAAICNVSRTTLINRVPKSSRAHCLAAGI